MTIESALVQLLNADAAFAALAGGRVYPQDGPRDGEGPWVVYATSDPDREMSFTAYLGLQNQSFRFDCYGGGERERYRSAKRVAAALRDCLFGFLRGEVVAPDGDAVNVQGVFPEGGEDGLEPPAHAEGAGLDYVAVQVRVYWNE